MSPATLTPIELQEKIGQVLGVSAWYAIDQALIDRFADVTLDHQFIHVDPQRAKAESPYGGTIAHGLLILSLISDMANRCLPLCENAAGGVNYGYDKIRFVAPVRSGKRVRGHFTLLAATPRAAAELLLRYAVSIEIEDEAKPALIADWLSLVFLAQQSNA
ncbi:MAG TPA: MaoC family dehydratase [Spongiibacteraceae bacterium]|nr:MaoC family dehydratase [Spongiibacteraceae bacterium]